jgi:hypothetical protein
MIIASSRALESPVTALRSNAHQWQDLADDLLFAIDRLEALNRKAQVPSFSRNILITISADHQSLSLCLNRFGARPDGVGEEVVRLGFCPLPITTDEARDDETIPPNASIDRAISKAAAEMLSWTKDPETFELVEHRRYSLFLQWPGEAPSPVNEYAYGLWDE